MPEPLFQQHRSGISLLPVPRCEALSKPNPAADTLRGCCSYWKSSWRHVGSKRPLLSHCGAGAREDNFPESLFSVENTLRGHDFVGTSGKERGGRVPLTDEEKAPQAVAMSPVSPNRRPSEPLVLNHCHLNLLTAKLAIQWLCIPFPYPHKLPVHVKLVSHIPEDSRGLLLAVLPCKGCPVSANLSAHPGKGRLNNHWCPMTPLT